MTATKASEIKKAMEKIHIHNMVTFAEPLYMEPFEFNPVIFDNEPYDPPETLQELVDDWMDTLNAIRELYIETEDDKYAQVLYDLLPAAIYERLN